MLSRTCLSVLFSMLTCTYLDTGNEKFHSLDLYFSNESTNATPLITLIHGGAWRSEDKSDYKDLALGFTKLGYSVASVNYRLSLKEEGEKVSSILHPAHIEDVGKAVEYLAKASHKYDPEKIYLVGHSAGAHIATMLLDTPTQKYIQGVLGVSGIYDIPLLLKTFPSYSDFIAQAFGTDESTYYDASPVNKQFPNLQGKRIYIAQSKEDSLVNNEQSEVMTKHLEKLGADVTMDLTLTGEHYDIMKIEKLAPLVEKLIL